MFETFRALEHWFREQDSNTAKVEVILSAPFTEADKIGFALARMADDLRFGDRTQTLTRITEGQINGIKFRVETR